MGKFRAKVGNFGELREKCDKKSEERETIGENVTFSVFRRTNPATKHEKQANDRDGLQPEGEPPMHMAMVGQKEIPCVGREADEEKKDGFFVV